MPFRIRPPASHRVAWRLNENGVRGAHWTWSLARRMAAAPTGLVEMPDGSILHHDPSDYVSRELYHGGYERAERWACTNLIRPGGLVLDVGANIGVYAQLAARLVSGHGKVIAFEPGPALPRLRLAVSHLTNVEVIPAAVGAVPGRAAMHVPAHQSGLASLRSNADKVDCRSVPVVRLDRCDAVPAREVDLIKIDVEGYEEQVLSGASGLYARDLVRATLLEVSPSFGPTDFVREVCARFGLHARLLSYRLGFRYISTTLPYCERDVKTAQQCSVLLLRSDVDPMLKSSTRTMM